MFLQHLGLVAHYRNKLSLSSVLLIDKSTVTDEPAQSLSDIPRIFLKKLMMVNATARSVKCNPITEEREESDVFSDRNSLDLNQDFRHKVNPLDIVTALFHCSDTFLQQEMAFKMSMCQFSVPLLLPHSETKRCTLMAWSLRDIVKKFRPHFLSDSRSFLEERIIQYDLPLVSFVRFVACSISKSKILNKLLSNPQQYHDIFVHRSNECGVWTKYQMAQWRLPGTCHVVIKTQTSFLYLWLLQT